MLQRLFVFLNLAGLTLATTLGAATFEVGAAVDRNEVELGESLHYSLSLQVNGRMDFPVQIDPPKFEGFQASQPMRSDSSSWVNGAVTEVHSFSWELIPIKAGTLTIPAVKANAKDALNGEVNKVTAAISIKVKRPKNAYSAASVPTPGAAPLPTYALQPQSQEPPANPAPDESGLRDIKADRGLPWARLGMVFGVFAAFLALLVWWARRPDKPAPDFGPVRDPRSAAFALLDAALKRLAAGDEKGFTIDVGHALRGYLRQRLDLRQETTLAEAMRKCRQRLPDSVDREKAEDLLLSLELLLYGDAKFSPADKTLLDQGSRTLINTMERLAGR